jgi:hypothetical protein
MDAQWPTNVIGSNVLEFTKNDRPDGYDFSFTVQFDRENGIPEIWATKGQHYQRPWGTEWSVEFNSKGVPPGQPASHIPTKIETKIVHGVDAEGTSQRSASVEMTIQYLDGHVTSTKKPALLPKETPDLSVQEYIKSLTQVFSQDPFRAKFVEMNQPDSQS